MDIKLSVVVITFNEEGNIGRCLDSVREVADDIVVVDSFSTDDTERICREKGARFIQHKFDGHIEQKNWAKTQTKYNYVLSIDADEALDEQLKNSILEVKQNWLHDAYSMNRLTNYCGKWIRHCGWYPDRKLRLWDRRKGHWTGINPHDYYELFQSKNTAHLNGNLLHYCYNNINEHIKQINYFSDIAAKAYFNKGIRSNGFRMLILPIFRFIRDYFYKLGVLDGSYGFVISVVSAHATFLKYAKLKQLQREL